MEIVGSPKEHVEKTLNDVLSKLKNEVKILKEDLHEPVLMENKKLWTAFSVVEFEVETIKRVLEVCYDYMPSVIEILDPAGLEMDCHDIADVFNDFLTKLHKYNSVIQHLAAENKWMMRELEAIRGKRIKLNKTLVKKEKPVEE